MTKKQRNRQTKKNQNLIKIEISVFYIPNPKLKLLFHSTTKTKKSSGYNFWGFIGLIFLKIEMVIMLIVKSFGNQRKKTGLHIGETLRMVLYPLHKGKV